MLYTYHLTLLRVQLYRFAWDCRDEGCFCESCSWTNLLLLHNINKAWVAFHIISLIFNGECAGQLGWLYLKLCFWVWLTCFNPEFRLQRQQLPGAYSFHRRIWLYQQTKQKRCSVAQLLQPHGLQHARLLCPSLSPRVSSNSCPLSR